MERAFLRTHRHISWTITSLCSALAVISRILLKRSEMADWKKRRPKKGVGYRNERMKRRVRRKGGG